VKIELNCPSASGHGMQFFKKKWSDFYTKQWNSYKNAFAGNEVSLFLKLSYRLTVITIGLIHNNKNSYSICWLDVRHWILVVESPAPLPLYIYIYIYFYLCHTENGDWMGILISWMNIWRHILWEIMRLGCVVSSQYSVALYWSSTSPSTPLLVMIYVPTLTLEKNSIYTPELFTWNPSSSVHRSRERADT
jgi:hypothetical protein